MSDVRRRDAIAAWVAGAGAGGLASARAGDAVRVLLLRRRLPDAGCPLLAGTIVAEGAGELAVGAALLAVAVLAGVGPEFGAPGLIWIVPALAGLGAHRRRASPARPRLRRGRRRRRPRLRAAQGARRLRARRAARGRSPAAPAGSARSPASSPPSACPPRFAAVLLVTAAQSGGRLVPFAPASVGAGAAMLAATFGPVTGAAVPAGELAAFFVGTSVVLTVVGTTLTLGISLLTVRWRGLVDAVRARRARRRLRSAGERQLRALREAGSSTGAPTAAAVDVTHRMRAHLNRRQLRRVVDEMHPHRRSGSATFPTQRS